MSMSVGIGVVLIIFQKAPSDSVAQVGQESGFARSTDLIPEPQSETSTLTQAL